MDMDRITWEDEIEINYIQLFEGEIPDDWIGSLTVLIFNSQETRRQPLEQTRLRLSIYNQNSYRQDEYNFPPYFAFVDYENTFHSIEF